jgi:hypothetical protein
MTASNHVVAGALIAAAVPQAAVALPIAFLSHFVMDALPHYGDNNKHSWLNRNFKYVLAGDILLSLAFLTTLLVWQPANWLFYIIAGLVAMSPDLLWFPYFVADLKHEHREPTRVARFLKWIQWGEGPWGIYVEIIFLAVCLSIFVGLVR